MAHIVENTAQVEAFFKPHGLKVAPRKLPSAGLRPVPVAQAQGQRHFYFLLEDTAHGLQVMGRCPFRNVTLSARGATYEEVRLALRTAVAEYAALVTAAYLEI